MGLERELGKMQKMGGSMVRRRGKEWALVPERLLKTGMWGI